MSVRIFALTYPQLMNQAFAKKLNEAEIMRLRNSYEVAERLFDGVYRAQHVPFICHVVRTASILLEENQTIEVVMAGLLHAAYSLGYFDDRRHGKATAGHRAQLQREVGIDVESLVSDYDCFPWYKKEHVCGHLEKLESYSDRERNLILMRLANELEDYQDFGMAYRGIFPYREKIKAYGKEAVELAQRLGCVHLVDELNEVFEAHLACKLPQIVITNKRESFQLPALKWLKKSYFERLQSKGKQLIEEMGKPKKKQSLTAGISK